MEQKIQLRFVRCKLSKGSYSPRGEQQVQKLTDEHTKTIDDLIKHKEAEIMEV